MEQKTSPVLLFKLLMEQMWHFLQVTINLPCILMIIVFWHGPKRDINDDIFIASSYRNFPDYVNQSTQLVSEFLIKLTFNGVQVVHVCPVSENYNYNRDSFPH